MPKVSKMTAKIVLAKEYDNGSTSPCCLAINKDGTRLLSCDDFRDIKLLDAKSLKLIKSLGNLGNTGGFVLDDKCVAVADGAKVGITIIDLKSGKNIAVLNYSGLFLCHSTLNLLAYPEPVGFITLFDLSKKKVVKKYNTGDETNCQFVISFSKKGILVVDSGVGKRRCLLWHPPYDKDPVAIPFENFFKCAAISPDERYLALGLYRENRAEVWDLKTNKKLLTLGKHTGHGDIRGVVYSPDGRFLASLGGSVGELILWETKDYREVARVTAHKSLINGLVFYPDSKQFATAGNSDTYIRLWNIQEGMAVEKSK